MILELANDLHKRRKTLRIARTFLPVLMGDKPVAYKVTKDALPPDAEVVACRMSLDGQTFELTMQSSHFPVVESDYLYPEITPTFSRLK